MAMACSIRWLPASFAESLRVAITPAKIFVGKRIEAIEHATTIRCKKLVGTTNMMSLERMEKVPNLKRSQYEKRCTIKKPQPRQIIQSVNKSKFRIICLCNLQQMHRLGTQGYWGNLGNSSRGRRLLLKNIDFVGKTSILENHQFWKNV